MSETEKIGLELLKDFLKTEQYPDVNDLKRFFTKLSSDPAMIPAQLKQYLVDVARKIAEGKQLLYKRDPAEERDHWLSGNIRVDEDGYTMKLSALELTRLGADFDGDTVAVYALFTEQAQKEARTKMNPKYSKSIWTPVASTNRVAYDINLDAAAAVHHATLH